MVQILLQEGLDVNEIDRNNRTPLHYAVYQNMNTDDDVNDRQKCIEHLVYNDADIDPCDIRQETPLHYASKYWSSELTKSLLDCNADLLITNRDGLNCLELAIEEKNEEVVKYFIQHDRIFELMRNAQERPSPNFIVTNSGVDTPMRKLIQHLPNMAFLVLEKCTITIGAKRTSVHKKVYNYEFLEDQHIGRNWAKSKNNS